MTTFMHAYSGETFDGRGSYNVQPSTPDPQVTGASFDFCTVCAAGLAKIRDIAYRYELMPES
jgi:hypothetical protein